jgi:hypothetical protein
VHIKASTARGANRKVKTMNTVAQARTHILEAVKVAGRQEVLDAIVRWNNTMENDIDADGDIWVANSQAGHWLNDESLIEFANFLD